MTATVTFNGFPKEGLKFLDDLKANNTRDWFEAHRQDYQETLLEPALAFITELGQRLQGVSPYIRFDTKTSGSGSLMRLNRDTRFSKDKTPYKTNLSALLWEGAGKKTEHPAFGFRLEPTRLSLIAGIFRFPKPLLEAYRDAVVDDVLGTELEKVIKKVRKAGNYTVEGEHYKRVPNGYDPEHPRAELLRYAGLYVHPPALEGKVLHQPELVEVCVKHFQTMAPVQKWLVKVNRKSQT